MHAINFEAPTSLDDALKVLAAHGEKARPLCGGTDLIIQMRAGVRRPEHVVDIKQIKELRELKYDAKNGLRLGAAVSCIEIHEQRRDAQALPGSDRGRASDRIAADPEPRVGGRKSLQRLARRRLDSSADRAGRARPNRRSQGRRARSRSKSSCSLRDELCSSPASCWSSYSSPAPAPHSSDAYLRFIPRNEMDIAVVGVGASLTLDGDKVSAARIGLGCGRSDPAGRRQGSRIV